MELNRQELITTLSNRVESHTGAAVSIFQNLTESELSKPSVAGGWSVAQCLGHLNSYGNYYLPKLRGVLSSAPQSNTLVFKSGFLGNYFTNMMEPSDKKYKAMKGHIPNTGLAAHAVVAEFIKQQEELLKLLEMANSRLLDKRIPISISKLIRLKTGDVFRFLIAHNDRHVQQALRNCVKMPV